MVLYKAGSVGIDIYPDTTGFGTKLRAALARYSDESVPVHVDVKTDVDDSGYRDWAKHAGNDHIRQKVKIDGDDSGWKKWMNDREKERQKLQRDWDKTRISPAFDDDDWRRSLSKRDKDRRKMDKDWDNTRFAPKFDDSLYTDGLRRMARSIDDARKDAGRKLSPFEKKVIDTKVKVDSSSVDDAAEKLRNLQGLVKSQTEERATLFSDMSGTLDSLDRLSADMAQERQSLKRLDEEYQRHKDTLAALRKEKTGLRKANDIEGVARAVKLIQEETTARDRCNERIRGTRTRISELTKEQNKLIRSLDTSRIDELTDSIGKNQKAVDDLRKRVKHSAADMSKSVKQFQDSYKGVLRNGLDRGLASLRLETERLAKTNSEAEKRAEAFADATDRQAKTSAAIKQQLDRQKQATKYVNDVLDQYRNRLQSAQAAQEKMFPWGRSEELNRNVNDAVARIDDLQRKINRMPSLADALLHNGRFENYFTSAFDTLDARLEDFGEKLRKEYEIKVRVERVKGTADSLENDLYKLQHTRLDIPVEYVADIKDAVAKLREIEARIKADPDRRIEYELELNLQLERAKRRLDEWKDKNDKLDMDVDLKSKLASAHLAVLTRPRSVDIYAKLHATDFGKLLDGMTYGATGLRGVNNQFQRLVNLFDTLDTKVPVLGAVGTVMAGLAAGATNLSGSVLGVGSSIVTMSKAALAAPGAIIGLGAAFTVLKHAWGDKGETFSTQIDIATTKLNGFGQAMDDAFYGKARLAIRNLMDDVSGTLIPGMTGIATAEGKVVEGIADIIRESDKAGELPVIFDTTKTAIDKLQPGVKSLVQSMLRLSDGTSQYLPRAANYMSELSAKFSEWVDKTRYTGEIVASMREVVEQGGYLKDTFKSTLGIAKGLYTALAESQNGIEGFSKAVGKADRAVNSARFQTTLRTWADGAKDAKESVRNAFSDIGSAAYALRDTTANVFRDAGATFGSFSSNVSRLLKNSGTGIRDFSAGVSSGFRKVFDAVGDASPAFSQLLSTVGRLSDTFGGTLAVTLKAATPLIEAVAVAAKTTADAFSRLPEPVQAAIGLYMTFGKAGLTAWNTVKTGLLENTVQTLAYQKTLRSLGVSAKQAGTGMKGAIAGFVAVNPALSSITGSVKAANGVLGKTGAFAKSAGSAVLGAFGGPVGVAVTAGVAALTTAMSDYVGKAQATEKASEDIRAALSNIPDSAKEAEDGISAVAKTIDESFNDNEFAETGFNWLSDVATGFDSTADAAEKLGMKTEDLAKTATGSQSQYEAMLGKLDAIYEKNNRGIATLTGNYGTLAGAAQKVRASLEKAREEYITNAEATAIANGHQAGFAENLIKTGEDSAALSILIGTQEQRTQMLSTATQQLISWQDRQRQSQQNALNAASEYGETYSNMGDAIANINELAGKTGPVWDENATGIANVTGSFNNMSEAGRQAQTALSNLGTAGHDWLKSMVESGATTDQVKAKQKELAEQFVDTANKINIPQDAVDQLLKTYGLTPEEVTTLFKAETEQTKTALTQYLSNLRAIFPEAGNTAIFKTILEGINSGAITSMDDVQAKMDELKKNTSTDDTGKYTIVLDANGEQALVQTELVKQHAELFKKGKDGKGYTTTLNATDLTKATLDYVNGKMDAYGKLVPTAKLNADPTGAKNAKDTAQKYADDWDIEECVADFNGDPTGAKNAKDTAMSYADYWAGVRRVAGFDGDATGARNAKDTAQDYANQWNGSTYNAQFGATTDEVQNAFWAAWNWGTSWASKAFNAVLGFVRGDAEGGEVLGSGVTRTGRVTGQGDNTSDSIPLNASTMVSTGEYVVKASSVRRMEELYGSGVMAAINATGSIPNKYITDARRTSRITLPSARSTRSTGSNAALSMPAVKSGDTYNQTFIYPSVTPIPVQRNRQLDEYANLGLI
ncbi:hypothetical protein [Bifidobacterium sp. SO1]|uniref:hypothetical protein n=1 Tax=Bifidobacterium sp. SO1 TaxID=2809029 RepID=UPI001BDD1733|nr:hypothetical protein [Bifidobacterium sp. SO1]MBT1161204.1 hypothetical protein [Bifidobacterium sp. SO1]